MTTILIGKSETSRLVGWRVSLRSLERLTFYRSALAVATLFSEGRSQAVSDVLNLPRRRMKRKQITITIETERVLIASRGRQETARCAECVEHVRMVSVDEAAALAGLNALDIYRIADAGRLHFLESGGSLLICPASLNDFTRELNRKTEREEL